MTTTTHPIAGTVVVGVDGSPSSEQAVAWAAQEARLRHRGLTLAHARKTISGNELAWLATAGIPPSQIDDQIRVDADLVLERARSVAAEQCPEASIGTVVENGDPRSLLLDLGRTAVMTVVGTRGHGRVAGLLLGSVSSALARHAQTPVVVVRPTQNPGGGILIGADGSVESIALVEHAFREASLRRSPLTVVHCLWDGLVSDVRWTVVSETDPEGEDARLRMAESIAGMGEKFPDVDAQVHVTRGAIDACLVDLSAQYDLLVIGRPARPLLRRLTLSGLTLPVVEHAQSPVLVVP
jgi:nucleotide-binding universal stress UspA family protein